jgi:hypothetical protein
MFCDILFQFSSLYILKIETDHDFVEQVIVEGIWKKMKIKKSLMHEFVLFEVYVTCKVGMFV